MGASPVRFQVDQSLKPAITDFQNSRHQVEIYQLKGDKLTLCVGMDGDRPAGCVTEKYFDHTYLLLKPVRK